MPHRDKEARAAYIRKYYADANNRKRLAARRKKHRINNMDKVVAYKSKYYEENKDKISAQTKKYRDGIKSRCIRHYSPDFRCTCACGCAVNKLHCLTLDHINNDGGKHRRDGCKGYNWVINNKFPSIFKVLCFNCNCGRAVNGGTCPLMPDGGNRG